MEKTVFSGLVTPWRLATWPTSRSPLLEMATMRPTNDADLEEVHGVGRTKLERWGADFLGVITSFEE